MSVIRQDDLNNAVTVAMTKFFTDQAERQRTADAPAPSGSAGWRKVLILAALLTSSAGAVVLSLFQAIEISAFAFAVGKVALGLVFLFAADKWLIPEFDTFEELKNGNVAVSVAFLGVCVLLAACIASN